MAELGETERWFNQAAADLAAAQRIAESTSETHYVVCFLAQQAVDKLLKSLLLAVKGNFDRVHAVGLLHQQATALFPDLLPLEDDAFFLDQFYTAARYPDALADPWIPAQRFTVNDARRALTCAENIFGLAVPIVKAGLSPENEETR